MKDRGITARENFLRAIEFRYPEWIPIVFELLPALWKRHGKALAELVLRHPLVFRGYERGQMTADSHDPPYREGCSFRDDWGCLWYNAQDGILGQVIEHPLESWADMKTLVVPDPAGGLMCFASPSSDVPLANIEAICDAWEEYRYFGYQQ